MPLFLRFIAGGRSLWQRNQCNEDIAARIVEGRSELRLETIKGILVERDEIVKQALVGGTAVQDGCMRAGPRVTGVWIGTAQVFDPATHRITLDISPTQEMRAALEQVRVEVLGEKNAGAYIGLVTDITTGKTDGTITVDEDILVSGDKIKVEPEDGSGMGVYFVGRSGTEYPLGRKLTENTRKKLIFRVPALPHGFYTLKIVTRYTGAQRLLNENRIITYEYPLIVPGPGVETGEKGSDG
ncbi:MAG: DUF4469 domain-containing protein [Treponema sp.]|jgi:hypothetical protein|nr:DUF4469 domain-containing protein [Treponema sp.]